MYIEVVSYIKNIISNTNRSTLIKKENRETVSYAKHIQTLVNRHRREYVSVNSFILPVHFETLIRQNQTLTKNEDRNISSYMKPIQTNISCQTKKEILKIYAYAHHEENLSNIYAIENPSCVEVI